MPDKPDNSDKTVKTANSANSDSASCHSPQLCIAKGKVPPAAWSIIFYFLTFKKE